MMSMYIFINFFRMMNDEFTDIHLYIDTDIIHSYIYIFKRLMTNFSFIMEKKSVFQQNG